MTQEFKPQDHPDFVGGWVWTEWEIRWIKERIEKAVLDEREACAKVAEDTDRMVLALLNVTSQPKHIANAIRARGEE